MVPRDLKELFLSTMRMVSSIHARSLRGQPFAWKWKRMMRAMVVWWMTWKRKTELASASGWWWVRFMLQSLHTFATIQQFRWVGGPAHGQGTKLLGGTSKRLSWTQTWGASLTFSQGCRMVYCNIESVHWVNDDMVFAVWQDEGQGQAQAKFQALQQRLVYACFCRSLRSAKLFTLRFWRYKRVVDLSIAIHISLFYRAIRRHKMKNEGNLAYITKGSG